MESNQPSAAFHALLALGFGGAAGYGYVVGDWVTASSVLLVITTTCIGYWSGMFRALAGASGLLLAIQYAEPNSHFMAGIYQKVNGGHVGFADHDIVVALTGLVIVLLVVVAARLFEWTVLSRLPYLGEANRWGGAVLGLAQGGLMVVLVIGGADYVAPRLVEYLQREDRPDEETQLDTFCLALLEFRNRSQETPLGEFVARVVPPREEIDEVVNEILAAQSGPATLQDQLAEFASGLRANPEAMRAAAARAGVSPEQLEEVLDSPEFEAALRDMKE